MRRLPVFLWAWWPKKGISCEFTKARGRAYQGLGTVTDHEPFIKFWQPSSEWMRSDGPAPPKNQVSIPVFYQKITDDIGGS